MNHPKKELQGFQIFTDFCNSFSAFVFNAKKSYGKINNHATFRFVSSENVIGKD